MVNLVLYFQNKEKNVKACLKTFDFTRRFFFSFPKILAEMYLNNFYKSVLVKKKNRQVILFSSSHLAYHVPDKKIKETWNIIKAKREDIEHNGLLVTTKF